MKECLPKPLICSSIFFEKKMETPMEKERVNKPQYAARVVTDITCCAYAGNQIQVDFMETKQILEYIRVAYQWYYPGSSTVVLFIIRE